MMNKPLAIMFLLVIALTSSCVKNSVEIEVVEDGCRWLDIKNANYDLLNDPCENGLFSIASNCAHNEDTSCIQYLKVRPKFYNTQNQEITLPNVNKTYATGDFYLDDNSISFEYDYQITDQSTPQTKVNYAVLHYFIESEFEDESNELALRIHFPCTEIDDDDYTIVNPDSIIQIDRTPGTFAVDFWDNAAEDGDLITAYINGEIITENLELFNDRKRFNVPKSLLNIGSNDLIVFALNEGSSGPNTVSMAVNGKEVDLGNFAKGLRTGNAVRIDF